MNHLNAVPSLAEVLVIRIPSFMYLLLFHMPNECNVIYDAIDLARLACSMSGCNQFELRF